MSHVFLGEQFIRCLIVVLQRNNCLILKQFLKDNSAADTPTFVFKPSQTKAKKFSPVSLSIMSEI